MSGVKFELRGLKSSDLFPMFTILSKIGIKDFKETISPDSIQNMIKSFRNDDQGDQENSEITTTVLGFSIMIDVLEVILKNLPKCEKDISQFLSNLSGMTVEDIADLDMGTFTEMIIAVLKKDEFKDFFKVASGLFN